MNELPLAKAFSLQKILNDIDTLNEEDARKIAKDFARLYFTTQQTWVNFTNWKVNWKDRFSYKYYGDILFHKYN